MIGIENEVNLIGFVAREEVGVIIGEKVGENQGRLQICQMYTFAKNLVFLQKIHVKKAKCK